MCIVAAVQFAPIFRKKRENLQRLATLIGQAAEAGAKLIVLPELATTGYTYMSRATAREDAEDISAYQPGRNSTSTMDVMGALAAKYDVHLVWGMVEVVPESGKLHNSQVYMEPSGYYEKYAKINRWANDFIWATAGAENPPVIQTDLDGGLRVGLLICRDARDKKDDDWDNFYSKGDADIVCLSTNWGKGGFPAVCWMDFVENNDTHLIVSNRYGQEGSNDFGDGGICIVTRDGEVHCEGLVWKTDCIVYTEV